MKIRKFLIAFALVAACALVWLLFYRLAPNKVGTVNEVAGSSTKQSTNLHLATNSVQNRGTRIMELAKNAGGQGAKGMTQEEALEVFKKAYAQAIERGNWEWRMPIIFHGKVLDENGSPLSGVTIEFLWNDLSPTGTSKTNTFSDAEGLFSLIGVTGKQLSVYLSKSGYLVQKRGIQFSFEYARDYERNFYRPDISNPVIFRMRKLGPGADLVTSQYGVKSYLGVSPGLTGKITWVDFFERKVGDAGQLQIQKWGESPAPETGSFDWRVILSIPDGGLIEHNDEFPFVAPESGYSANLEWSFKRNQPDWQDELHKSFYIKFGSPPKFGRIVVKATGKSGIRLEYAINPTGSRDLQQRPAQPPKLPTNLPPGTRIRLSDGTFVDPPRQ